MKKLLVALALLGAARPRRTGDRPGQGRARAGARGHEGRRRAEGRGARRRRQPQRRHRQRRGRGTGGPAATATPPTPNKGDNAWMIVATLLVIMMSIPGLALFYGGLVRSKNMLSVLMQVFVIFSLIVVLWMVYGYSIAFTEGNAFFGGFDRLFLSGIFTIKDGAGSFATAATFSKGVVIPEYLFVVFQATFAAITVGADRRRVRRAGEVLRGAAVRGAVVHVRLSADRAHGLVLARPGRDHGRRDAAPRNRRRAGWLWQKGALDFAGGTVVHINAGVAGLVGAYVIGKRVGYGRESMAPHNLTFTMVGASLLWVGWFGFNAGSALEAGDTAALAFVNTLVATAAAVLSWMTGEWMSKGKPSMLGAASGAVAGLVAITPACGFVGVNGALILGLLAGFVCLWGVNGLKRHARRRRRARRVRRARRRRDPRRDADRRVRRAEPRRPGHLRLRRQQGRPRLLDRRPADHPGDRRADDASSGPASSPSSPTRSSIS